MARNLPVPKGRPILRKGPRADDPHLGVPPVPFMAQPPVMFYLFMTLAFLYGAASDLFANSAAPGLWNLITVILLLWSVLAVSHISVGLSPGRGS